VRIRGKALNLEADSAPRGKPKAHRKGGKRRD